MIIPITTGRVNSLSSPLIFNVNGFTGNFFEWFVCEITQYWRISKIRIRRGADYIMPMLFRNTSAMPTGAINRRQKTSSGNRRAERIYPSGRNGDNQRYS